MKKRSNVKTCRYCNRSLSRELFKTPKSHYCNECREIVLQKRNEYRMQWARDHPDKTKEYQRRCNSKPERKVRAALWLRMMTTTSSTARRRSTRRRLLRGVRAFSRSGDISCGLIQSCQYGRKQMGGSCAVRSGFFNLQTTRCELSRYFRRLGVDLGRYLFISARAL